MVQLHCIVHFVLKALFQKGTNTHSTEVFDKPFSVTSSFINMLESSINKVGQFPLSLKRSVCRSPEKLTGELGC